MLALVILLAIAVALLGVLVVGLLRSHAEVLRRLHELGAGVYDDTDDSVGGSADGTTGVTTPVEIKTQPGVAEPRPIASAPGAAQAAATAHDISGATPDGGAIAVAVNATSHTTLLAFLTSGCSTCQGFWQAFGAGEADALPGRDTRLVIVTGGADRESPAAVQSIAPPRHTTVMSSEGWDAYEVPASPYFILVDGPTSRIIGEGAAASWSQVFELLTNAVADAGIDPLGRPVTTPSQPGRMSGPERADRVQRELAAAGIEPGHASLYPAHSDVFPEGQATAEGTVNGTSR